MARSQRIKSTLWSPTHHLQSLIAGGSRTRVEEFVILILLSRFLCALPLRWVLNFGRLLGLIWYYLIPVRVSVARKNMRRVLGDNITDQQLRTMTRRCCQHMAMNILEGFRIPELKRELDSPRFDLQGVEIVEQAADLGKGIAMVSLHMGNFELFIANMACRNFPLHVVYKDIHWKAAHDFWNLVRDTTGIKAIAPRKSKSRIKEVLAQGEFVGFASDQHMPPHRAIVCEFLGQLAATTPAAPRFALETGAAIVLAFTVRKDEDLTHHLMKYEAFELETPFETTAENIRHNTQRLNDWMGSIIRAYPEQWLWHHKRFKIDKLLDQYDIPPHLEHLIESNHA